MILLDTHVLIWAVEESGRLGHEARESIESADTLVYSAITAWELAMLVSKERIRLTNPPATLLARAGEEAGVYEVAITSEIALDAGSLPPAIHGDPADRFVMATARALGCPVLTADEKILAYAGQGYVSAIDARR